MEVQDQRNNPITDTPDLPSDKGKDGALTKEDFRSSEVVRPMCLDFFLAQPGRGGNLPREIAQNPVLLEQAENRREVYRLLRQSHLQLKEEDKLSIELRQKLYVALSEFLEADEVNSRIILYLPFEILPDANMENLGEVENKFLEAYKRGWQSCLDQEPDEIGYFRTKWSKQFTEEDAVRKWQVIDMLPNLIEAHVFSPEEWIRTVEQADRDRKIGLLKPEMVQYMVEQKIIGLPELRMMLNNRDQDIYKAAKIGMQSLDEEHIEQGVKLEQHEVDKIIQEMNSLLKSSEWNSEREYAEPLKLLAKFVELNLLNEQERAEVTNIMLASLFLNPYIKYEIVFVPRTLEQLAQNDNELAQIVNNNNLLTERLQSEAVQEQLAQWEPTKHDEYILEEEIMLDKGIENALERFKDYNDENKRREQWPVDEKIPLKFEEYRAKTTRILKEYLDRVNELELLMDSDIDGSIARAMQASGDGNLIANAMEARDRLDYFIELRGVALGNNIHAGEYTEADILPLINLDENLLQGDENKNKLEEARAHRKIGLVALFRAAINDGSMITRNLDTIKAIYEKGDKGEKKIIARGLFHGVNTKAIDARLLTSFNLKMPQLHLLLPESGVESLEEVHTKRDDLRALADQLRQDPELATVDPFIIISGGRIKGYDLWSDVDLTLSARDKTTSGLEKNTTVAQISEHVMKRAGDFGVEDVFQLWSKEEADSLLVDSIYLGTDECPREWVNALFTGVWIGDKENITITREKFLRGYLDAINEPDVQEATHITRKGVLRAIERDATSRLTQRGFRRFYPQGYAEEQQPLYEGMQDVFSDTEYRWIASMLYAGRVFLPDLS